MKKSFNLHIIPILIVASLTTFALFELSEGITNNGTFLDNSLEFGFLIICVILIILYRKRLGLLIGLLSDSNKTLSEQIIASSVEAEKWRLEAQATLISLNEKINSQFCRWNLSKAEKQVAMELLKGLSHKEIANLRQSSEKTVRLQAASVYRKALIDGRAQLSAFFLTGLQIIEDKN